MTTVSIDDAEIQYAIEPDLTPAEFVDVLVRSTLAPRRPIHAPEIIIGLHVWWILNIVRRQVG